MGPAPTSNLPSQLVITGLLMSVTVTKLNGSQCTKYLLPRVRILEI